MKKFNIIITTAILQVLFVFGIANAAADQPGGSPLSSMALMAVLFIGMYFLFIRPQNKRAKEHQSLINQVAAGDEVMVSGGMIGKISAVKDQFIVLTVAEGVEIKMQKQAVTQVLPKGTLKSI